MDNTTNDKGIGYADSDYSEIRVQEVKPLRGGMVKSILRQKPYTRKAMLMMLRWRQYSDRKDG